MAWQEGSHPYRLPTDQEWSLAAGIGTREATGGTPAQLNGKINDAFPWGDAWPPPTGVGNYADNTAKKKFPKLAVIDGYNDGYATTAPVLHFKPNPLGIYNMGGNVREWCDDWYTSSQRERITRGASWQDYDRDLLLLSYRGHANPRSHGNSRGFRCVVVAQ